MKCKYCNADIEQDAQFCPNCGKELSKFNKCVKCGELLDDDASFCPHCGTEQPHYEEDNGSKKWLWVVVGLLFIGLIGGGYYLWNRYSNKTEIGEEGVSNDNLLEELGKLNALLLQYDDAGDLHGDCVAVKSKNKWGMINLKGDTILDFKYDEIKCCMNDSAFWNIKVKSVDNSKDRDYYDVGIADAKGKIIVKPIKGNQFVSPLSDGLYIAHDGKKEPHLYDDKGEEVFLCDDGEEGYEFPLRDIKKVNDSFYMVYSGYAWFRTTFNKGTKPKLVSCDVSFLDAKPFSDICFVKNEENKWGAINSAGEIVIPFNYSDINIRFNTVYVKNEENKWGAINSAGEIVIPFNYYDENIDINKVLLQNENGKWEMLTYINSIDDYFLTYDGETFAVLNKQGKELFRNKNMKYYPFYSNGMFLSLHSVIDNKGNAIITLNDSLHVIDYLNNYVLVGTSNNLCGIVDKKGIVVVPFTYEMMPRVQEGTSLITIDRCVKDEVVNGEREVVFETDIFNTNSGKLTRTNLYIPKFRGKFALAEIEGRHLYVNEEGKTGL